MSCYDGSELCGLYYIYIQSLLETNKQKDQMGLDQGNGYIIFWNIRNQKTGESIDFKIQTTRNLTDFDFLSLNYILERNLF